VSRADRKVLVAAMREQRKAWPEQLAEVPREQWPPRRSPASEYPLAVWRSRHYLAVVYPAPIYMAGPRGIQTRRLSVNRVTLRGDGRWDENIPWDDLQRCKRETGHGDWYGLEVYPRDRDIVNDANMRHLWLLAEPLEIGWFAHG
jgi:hypothetical protein